MDELKKKDCQLKTMPEDRNNIEHELSGRRAKCAKECQASPHKKSATPANTIAYRTAVGAIGRQLNIAAAKLSSKRSKQATEYCKKCIEVSYKNYEVSKPNKAITVPNRSGKPRTKARNC